jgi:hypothetical protein
MNFKYTCLFEGERQEMWVNPNNKQWVCPCCGSSACLIRLADIGDYFDVINIPVGHVFIADCSEFEIGQDVSPGLSMTDLLLVERIVQ